MTVVVTFEYEPDEPDEGDPTGMSEDEFNRLQEQLIEMGADNIEMARKVES